MGHDVYAGCAVQGPLGAAGPAKEHVLNTVGAELGLQVGDTEGVKVCPGRVGTTEGLAVEGLPVGPKVGAAVGEGVGHGKVYAKGPTLGMNS